MVIDREHCSVCGDPLVKQKNGTLKCPDCGSVFRVDEEGDFVPVSGPATERKF